MDPASATVAFVGFAASLATLAGLVIESAQSINNFCNRFERAPKELQRFQATVRQLNCLLVLLKEQTSQHADGDLPQTLQDYWLENIAQMRKDYETLTKIGSKLQNQFDSSSTSRKHVRARVRQFFCSEEISELETRLSDHVAKLHLALTMIAQIRGQHMDSTLAAISQQTVMTHSTLQNGLQESQSISRCREEYLVRVAEEISGMRQDLRSAFDRETKPNFSSRQREPWSTAMKGSSVPPQLLWILRETSRKSIVRNYWFGLLHLACSSETMSMTRFQEDVSLNSSTGPFNFQITFVPPWWVSDTLIAVAINSSMNFSVNRAQVNNHPRIMEVVRACDVNGLKDLFGRGIARPTDLVVDPRVTFEPTPIPLLQMVSSLSKEDLEGEYATTHSWPDFYRFVLQETGAMSTDTNDELCADLLENFAYKKSEICDILIKQGVDCSYILNTVAWSGLHEISNLVAMYAQGPRSFVHEFITRYIDLEDFYEMTTINSWILRAIARSEPRFSSKLRAQSCGLRSSKSHGRSKAGWRGVDLSIETQLSEMGRAKSTERRIYLLVMCAGGIAADLDALIMHPEAVPELISLSGRQTCLRVSAQYGNKATFCRLLDTTECVSFVGMQIHNALARQTRIPSHFDALPSSHEARTDMMERFLTRSGVSEDVMMHLKGTLLPPDNDYAPMMRSSYHLSTIDLSLAPLIPMLHETRMTIAQNDWLVMAVTARDDIVALERLVHSGYGLEWENECGFTPLMIAIANCAKQATRILIEAGAEIFERKSCGFSVSNLARALRTEIEIRGFLVLSNLVDLVGVKAHRLISQSHVRGIDGLWEYQPGKGANQWFHKESREQLLELLALVPQTSLEVEHDSGQTSPDLSTTPTTDIDWYRYVRDTWLFRPKHIPENPHSSRIDSEPFKFDAALVIIGYVLGITVHACYDLYDSLSWILRVPRPVIRLLVVVGSVLLYRWFWTGLSRAF